jgi:hypothetical protein
MWLVGEIGEMHKAFWWRDLKEEDLLEDLVVDGRIILKLNFKTFTGRVNWVDVDQYRDKWQAVVHAVINVWVP